MTIKFLIRFLPEEYQALLVLAQRIVSSFDTKEKAMEFFEVVADSLKDGKIKTTEWERMGSKAGIFTTRQMQYQNRNNQQGLCKLCSAQIWKSGLCEKHYPRHLELNRQRYHRFKSKNLAQELP